MSFSGEFYVNADGGYQVTTAWAAQESRTILRVLLADDHAIFRDGVRAILKENDLQVISEASDGLQAVKACAELAPEVAVLDISMPLLNGLDAARKIRMVSPATRVVILTMHDEERYVLAALRAGASAYVLKSTAASHLIKAIDATSHGEIYLSPGISKVRQANLKSMCISML